MAQPGEGINEKGTLEEIQANHSPSVEIETFPGGHNLHRTNFDALAKRFDEFLART